MDWNELKNTSIFPVGEPNDAYAQYFDGQSWLNMLSLEQVSIGNVSFEPGCRTTTGTSTTPKRAAVRSCWSRQAGATIRNGANRPGNCIPGTW